MLSTDEQIFQNEKYTLQTPQKNQINLPDKSTNYCEGLTTTEQNDKIYLMNMELSKLQNSNITQSGNFPPILTNVTNDKDNDNIISPFEIENTNTINDSYITLKDLNVTPIQETHSNNEIENNDEIQCTPISTLCNYYLQSESNTNKTKDMMFNNTTNKNNNTINNTGKSSSDKKRDVNKFLTVNKKINFNNNEYVPMKTDVFSISGNNSSKNNNNNIKIVKITSFGNKPINKNENETKQSFDHNNINQNKKQKIFPKRLELLKPRSLSANNKKKTVIKQQPRPNSLNDRYININIQTNNNYTTINTNNFFKKTISAIKHKHSFDNHHKKHNHNTTPNSKLIKQIIQTIKSPSLSKHKSKSSSKNPPTSPKQVPKQTNNSKQTIPLNTPNQKSNNHLHIYTPYTPYTVNKYIRIKPKSNSQSRQTSIHPTIPLSTARKYSSFISKYTKSQSKYSRCEPSLFQNITLNTSKYNSKGSNSVSKKKECSTIGSTNQTQSSRISVKPFNTEVCETIPTSKGVVRLMNKNSRSKMKGKTKAKIINVLAIQQGYFNDKRMGSLSKQNYTCN